MSERLDVIRGRIARAGGDPENVTIVAVTKGFGTEACRTAAEVGLLDIGENYAAELEAKAAELAADGALPAGDVRWHYLGAVQRRKVRTLARVVSLWQGVSRLVEGTEIARHRPGAEVLVEVDVTGQAGRGGVPPGEVAALAAGLAETGVVVKGLMIVAPAGGGETAFEAFSLVARLADDLDLQVRSMGMSGDLEQAVRAGSTMVRVGEALFGPRPTAARLAQ